MNVLEFVDNVLNAAGVYLEWDVAMEPADIEELEATQLLIGTQPNYPLTNVPVNFYNEDGTVWVATQQPNSFSSVNPYAPKEIWD